jgi:hypothetical protein
LTPPRPLGNRHRAVPKTHADSQVVTSPGVVVLHWSEDSMGLLEQLARAMAGVGLTRITCVSDGEVTPTEANLHGVEILGRSIDAPLGSDSFAEALRALDISHAHAVIVLPRSGVDEPDSGSRLTCAAIRRACGSKLGPNILVEIEDPEAAFEFVGLGVATVFYPGHLRAALLGQACVDLGVFQFVVGLLRGRHHLRSLPVPDNLRERTFAEAALTLELDERGHPMTVIGIGRARPEQGQALDVLVNPGPRTPLRDVVCLMALISGEGHDA